MDYTQAVIMGILQGLVQWLPINSSGHVMDTIITILGMSPSEAYSYLILFHMGALLALFYKFRYDLGKILMKLLRFRWEGEESFLFYSTLFTFVIGIPLYKGFKSCINPEIINGLIGIILVLTGLRRQAPLERVGKEIRQSKEEVTVVDALIAGLAQGIAVIPGISRSGMTIGALLFLGIDQKKAVRMSFLMAVFAITGSLFLEGKSLTQPLSLSLTAVLSSFAVSLLMMEAILKLAKKLDFSKFCMVFGVIATVMALLGVLL
ncbi:undecaprenyl-diphosphate phosphatase [Thermococcus sp.]